MVDADATLPSPLACTMAQEKILLCLTIVWHPELERIGEQAILPSKESSLARLQPTFCKPLKDGLPLGHSSISRTPIYFSLNDANAEIEIKVPESRMVVEVDGNAIQGSHSLSFDQINNGVMIGLGRTVLLCLHWLTELPKNNALEGVVGVSSSIQKVRDLIYQAAKINVKDIKDATVLILGETGTGKEVVARAIHAHSQRNKRPMVSVNMAALSTELAAADLFGATKGAFTGSQNTREGLFKQAEYGTLFLDEIGNTPTNIQPMLLRILDTDDYRPLGASLDHKNNARIIAATDQDLYDGTFNPALLNRLKSFEIHLPPLRHRREDIGVLIVHLMRSPSLAGIANQQLAFSLLTQFSIYDWPGNVRQLRHFLKRVLIEIAENESPSFSSLVGTPPQRVTHSAAPIDLSSTSVPPRPEKQARKKLNELNEDEVLTALTKNEWNVQSAALALGISRPSMYKLMEMNSQVRRAEKIPREEMLRAWDNSHNNIEICAALLKTPAEALRRHLRGLGIEADMQPKRTLNLDSDDTKKHTPKLSDPIKRIS